MTNKVHIKPLILIVDDTPTNIQVLAECLMPNYRIKVAADGKAALEVLSKQELPDLILLDIMMPDIDGYEVCIRLKKNPDTQSIPVIFITALSTMADEERGLKLGAVDYITKPFHLPIVKARIHNHIQLKLLTDKLESLAWIDGLTGIPNRRRFDETFKSEWKRSQRSGIPLSLIMIDVDHFKYFNDHYGHVMGDDCLKKIASILDSLVVRAGDMVARYGGEEFVLLMPGADAACARLLAEQLNNQIEAQQISHAHSPVSNWVTISVGYASHIPEHDSDPSLLLKETDEMLYYAKHSGRNRVHGQ